MINEIDILHERHSCDFTCHAGKETARLLCIVPNHHEIVVELGKYCFNTFAEPFVCPSCGSPVFLIRPIWNFKSDIGHLKEILLNFGTETAFVSKHHTIMIFPAYIVEEMKIMDACRRHIIRMYDTTYTADCMEFISVIVHPLRGTISPIRSSGNIVAPHGTTLCPCVPADLYRFGVDAKYVFSAVNGNRYILADFFGKPRRQLTTRIELTATYQVWQIILAFIVQAMKQEIFTIEAEGLSSYAERDDFKVGELRDNPTSGHISEFIHTISSEILADSKNSDEILL